MICPSSGEHADFQRALRAHHLREQGEKLPLLRRDLHARLRQLCRLLAQPALEIGLPQRDAAEVVVQRIRHRDRAIGHGALVSSKGSIKWRRGSCADPIY
jgi:hypothetical protein